MEKKSPELTLRPELRYESFYDSFVDAKCVSGREPCVCWQWVSFYFRVALHFAALPNVTRQIRRSSEASTREEKYWKAWAHKKQSNCEHTTFHFPFSPKNETWKLDTSFLLSGVRGKRKSENHVRSNFRRFTQPSRTRKETALLFAFLLVKDFRGLHEGSHFKGRRPTATHF